ncbi:MAG TPA: SDR family NAD(P)-dependent oxidoreductase [Candidatus Sulfotelmatobacter sp.]|nr:SDR family NAD(P)-dependent oxidoreductase [Candidatus Sulfotelmatobacter sp.]
MRERMVMEANSHERTASRLPLKGQVAVITGGGRGIGRAIARSFAAAGATTAVLARSQSELAETVATIESAGGRARAFPVDVKSAKAIKTALADVERRFGPVSLLVNNAGMLGPIGPFAESDVDKCWRTFDVNLRGPMLCTHAVLPGMIARRRGRIINIASSAIPIPYFSSYVTSKTALTRFTESAAAEVKAHGVSMFSVGPGTTRTAMSEYSLNSPEGRKWLPWFKKIFDQGLDVPIERPAQLVLALASGKADALSGRHISVSDDLDSLLAHVEQIEANNLFSLRIRTLNGSSANSALAAIRSEAGRADSFSLHLERTFVARRDKVFRAWTDPEIVRQWFIHAANVHWISDPHMDVREGGSYDWHVVNDDNAHEMFHFRGTYRNIESPGELVFTWNWQTLPIEGVKAPGYTLVSVRFESVGEATKLILTQEGLPNEAAHAAHDKGWQRCFDGIASLLGQTQ